MTIHVAKRVQTLQYLEVMKLKGANLEGLTVHHKDGNKLNNCKGNLEVVSLSDNSKAHKSKCRGHANFKGYDVKWTSTGPHYHARIGVDYKSVHLGTYNDEVEAAIAYDLAALEYIGKKVAILCYLEAVAMTIHVAKRVQTLQYLEVNFPDNDYAGMTLQKWVKEKAIDHRTGEHFVSEKRKKRLQAEAATVVPKYISVSGLKPKTRAIRAGGDC